MLLLGTYRIYSWLFWANLGVSVLGLMGGEQIRTSLWFGIPAVLVTVLFLWVVHALYWRLGYDSPRRLIFVLGHLSVLFALSEYFMAISADMFAYMDKHSRGQGFSV